MPRHSNYFCFVFDIICLLINSRGRDKSPSDLEADDENDHDSLNQSETGSTLSLTTSTTNTTTTTANLEKAKTFLTNSNTPVIRPTTPTGMCSCSVEYKLPQLFGNINLDFIVCTVLL